MKIPLACQKQNRVWLCLEAENVLKASQFGPSAVILRLAGIYGPGRLLRRTKDLLAGNPIVAPKDNYLNLIHVDDAAAIVAAAETHGQTTMHIHSCRWSSSKIWRLHYLSCQIVRRASSAISGAIGQSSLISLAGRAINVYPTPKCCPNCVSS